jgi:hypothetical protein
MNDESNVTGAHEEVAQTSSGTFIVHRSSFIVFQCIVPEFIPHDRDSPPPAPEETPDHE